MPKQRKPAQIKFSSRKHTHNNATLRILMGLDVVINFSSEIPTASQFKRMVFITK